MITTHIDDIYEIDKGYYKDFLYRTHSNVMELHTEEDDRYILTYTTYKKNGQILFARKADKEKMKNTFYLVNLPFPEDLDEPIAYQRVTLTTPEQVQAYLKGMAKLQKESES